MQYRIRKQARLATRLIRVSCIGVSLGASAFLAQAQTSMDHSGHQMTVPAVTAPADAMTIGEVRKVDKPSGKVTIRHGEIKNLNMGAMTMVFRAQEPAMLDTLKEGDKISFSADMVKGVLTLTKVMPAQ